MSSIDMSYNLVSSTRPIIKAISNKAPQKKAGDTAGYKYLDIDSTYRNRHNYPNPNDFVIPITYPGRDSTAATSIDPVVGAIPYTGSTDPPGTNVTQVSSDTSHITLDPQEINIDNYYINSVLEIAGEFRIITHYDGTTKIATLSLPFSVLPSNGTVYFTRKIQPFFVGTIVSQPLPTSNTFALDPLASSIDNVYTNSYVRFTSGANSNLVRRVTQYIGNSRLITISGNLPNVPILGDRMELDSFSYDNAGALLYSGNQGNSTYYEIDLIWLSVPNQILGVGYGGTLDRYPYVYVRLFNEGNRLTNQAMYSNNPNSPFVLFKVPVNQYFGNTSFITLADAKTKQVVRFDPVSDIRFVVTLPDGEIIKFANDDSLSPLSPDPFLQVNALFSIKRM
jgi:hypothetical protein